MLIGNLTRDPELRKTTEVRRSSTQLALVIAGAALMALLL